MSSYYGENIRLMVFGQSHSAGIGMVLDGIPAGEPIDLDELQAFMERRAPGRDAFSTKRKEPDRLQVLSGLANGRTCGAPLCMVIANQDAHPGDYAAIQDTPRPGHADFSAAVKYHGCQDASGGGHFSGRLTAPICAAGGVILQILKRKGIEIGAHIAAMGGIQDILFDAVRLDPETLNAVRQADLPVLDPAAGEKMRDLIEQIRQQGDSVGGVIECGVTGLPAGIGSAMFGGLESRIAQIVFGIPAVKGLEFGAGFAAAAMRGSEHNDAFCFVSDFSCKNEEDTFQNEEDALQKNAGAPQKDAAGVLQKEAAGALQKESAGALQKEAAGILQKEADPVNKDTGILQRDADMLQNDADTLSRVRTVTNHHGGILGGISTGMPLVFRAAFKPTPSISLPQKTVNLRTGEETEIRISGRHDPCIVRRAVPVVEAACAIAIYDAFLKSGIE